MHVCRDKQLVALILNRWLPRQRAQQNDTINDWQNNNCAAALTQISHHKNIQLKADSLFVISVSVTLTLRMKAEQITQEEK